MSGANKGKFSVLQVCSGARDQVLILVAGEGKNIQQNAPAQAHPECAEGSLYRYHIWLKLGGFALVQAERLNRKRWENSFYTASQSPTRYLRSKETWSELPATFVYTGS